MLILTLDNLAPRLVSAVLPGPPLGGALARANLRLHARRRSRGRSSRRRRSRGGGRGGRRLRGVTAFLSADVIFLAGKDLAPLPEDVRTALADRLARLVANEALAGARRNVLGVLHGFNIFGSEDRGESETHKGQEKSSLHSCGIIRWMRVVGFGLRWWWWGERKFRGLVERGLCREVLDPPSALDQATLL
ncbi:unnamed protein product [Chondrus crispus]|uniref:Uncharacterized protein n=1 Tax=Chondrus crispus TaxID=2769 RepID=R7QCY3_CHOCR|nr:unnamed protein product [Chondrus crispus]CDF35628.1 unnamed protein product [Chondrus crispus]|eukprot:XP_005715447.1 unnamed protein product [Chondrus crispus]